MQPPILGSNKVDSIPLPEKLKYQIPVIWEYTQAIIACLIVFCNMIVGIHIGLLQGRNELPPTLTNALFVVIGFYFGRANPALLNKGK
jgi:hypothetical protein